MPNFSAFCCFCFCVLGFQGFVAGDRVRKPGSGCASRECVFGWELSKDKEISVYDTFDDPEGRRVIISFDTGREVFHGIPEPSELQRLPLRRDLDLKLIVWNESVALFALFFENHQNYRYPKPELFEMWVMDDNSKCAWTKQLTIAERTECPPEMFPQTYRIFFSRPVEFLMVHNGRVVCFNLCTKKRTYIPTGTRGEFVGYVNSIVLVMGHNHKPESIENNCSDKDEDVMVAVEGKRESCRRQYSYSVWAIPPADVSH